jgi:hypothetical protein
VVEQLERFEQSRSIAGFLLLPVASRLLPISLPDGCCLVPISVRSNESFQSGYEREGPTIRKSGYGSVTSPIDLGRKLAASLFLEELFQPQKARAKPVNHAYIASFHQ